MEWTYKSKVEDVVDFSGVNEAKGKAKRAIVKSNNDIYLKIKDTDDRLKKYYNRVLKVINDEQKNYGLNSSSVLVDGKGITTKPVVKLYHNLGHLMQYRKKIKKKIKRETLKKRLKVLKEMEASFKSRKDAGKSYSKSEYKKVTNEITRTNQRIAETG